MIQLALQLHENGGRRERKWHPLLEFPLMIKCFCALQPELVRKQEKNKPVLDAIADYLLDASSQEMSSQLTKLLNEDLADPLRGMKIMMKENDLKALQQTLAEKKVEARERLERLLRDGKGI